MSLGPPCIKTRSVTYMEGRCWRCAEYIVLNLHFIFNLNDGNLVFCPFTFYPTNIDVQIPLGNIYS